MSDPTKEETSSTQPPSAPDPATVASNAALSAEASARHAEAAAELAQESASAAEKALGDLKQELAQQRKQGEEVTRLLTDMMRQVRPGLAAAAVTTDVTGSTEEGALAEPTEQVQSPFGGGVFGGGGFGGVFG